VACSWLEMVLKLLMKLSKGGIQKLKKMNAGIDQTTVNVKVTFIKNQNIGEVVKKVRMWYIYEGP